MAVHLRDTIQQTGHWGAVRVVPTQSEALEVIVAGKIERSDGEQLTIQMDAYDATGTPWFSKRYKKQVPPSRYHQAAEAEIFQDVYNRIANDLYFKKLELSPERVEDIRRIAGLRFAGSLAPDSFDGHLAVEEGRYEVLRLPATDDPMLDRVLRIREREYLMVDVINGYYDNLYDEMSPAYYDWRRLSVEEAEALAEIKRKSTQRYLLGAGLILGAIAVDVLSGSNSVNTDSLSDVMVIGGAMAVKGGMDLGAQKQLHKDAIREMGESFRAEVSPMIVEVEGQTTELTGSAEEQFIKWRELLQQIYQTETGLPVPSITTDGPPDNDGEQNQSGSG